MSLPADATRCLGIDPDRRYICPDRHICQRHTDWFIEHCGTYPVRLLREPGQECEYMMRGE